MTTRSDASSGTLDFEVLEHNGTRLCQLTPPRGVPLTGWLLAHSDGLRSALLRVGAVRLTGTGLGDPSALGEVAATVSGKLLEYTERTTPRARVRGSVFTSTEYPANQHILQHNETSYTREWPDHVFFLSARTAEHGGQTPVADSRSVLRGLPTDLVRRFTELGVRYTRSYHAGLGLPWQEVFQTEDRGEVEKYCRANEIEWEWDDDLLRTRQLRPAVAVHPVTGETVWFNQAHLFHVLGLDPDSRDTLLDLFDEQDLPSNAYYGDGTPITEEDLAAIGQAYEAETLAADWSDGDLLIVDNMLMSHGRAPYQGARKVLVAMTRTDWAAWT